jgi:tetratricopeptide (TPR) repeat protein
MISQSSDIYKEKIESYKQTIRINPDNADVHYNLGVAFVCAGMHKEAIESFQQVIRINPDDTDAHSALEQYEMLKSIDPKLAN